MSTRAGRRPLPTACTRTASGTASGDGWRFRGRGLLQVTGRANYRAAGRAVGVDLEQNPELLEEPLLAALAAAHFWKANGLNEIADHRADDDDAADFRRISKAINGGYHGLADRQARWARTASALAKDLPPGTNGAVVGIATDAAVNAAVVHRVGERFAVGAWIGKTWGSRIQGGGAIRAS